MPAASFRVPEVGACFYSRTFRPFDVDVVLTPAVCAQVHVHEVVAVGRFAGETASERPAVSSTAYRRAYTDCSAAATAYLGGDWHTADVELHFWLPSAAAWQGGDRHYACGLIRETSRTLRVG
jgi:Septum formation